LNGGVLEDMHADRHCRQFDGALLVVDCNNVIKLDRDEAASCDLEGGISGSAAKGR